MFNFRDRGAPIIRYRQGTSFARGVLIDGFLSDQDVKVLYERWLAEWPEPEDHRGGEKAIHCEMVLEVPIADLVKIYGKQRAGRIFDAAKANAVL